MKDPQKILLVEDEKSLINALAEKLRSENFNVLETSNGEEALKVITSFRPDLILLDLKMPKMDGVEFMQKIRAQEEGKEKKQKSLY